MKTSAKPTACGSPATELTITVGDESCQIKGFTNLHIQCAVDRVAMAGGGRVLLSAGVFDMEDALHLRSRVQVTGAGERTVLRKAAMRKARLATYIGYGHHDLIVDDPAAFTPGMGVIVSSAKTGGFLDTTGTLVRREGDAWFLDRAMNMDYLKEDDGCVRTLFPLVSAVEIEDATVEDILLDGNGAANERMNSCRGGGFYARASNRIAARRLIVRDYNGEGFSFQTCDDLVLEDCTAERCGGNGYHPGSGSNRFRMIRCAARECGACGLFYCLRVRDGLVEDCLFENNRTHGIGVWSRDERNTNRRLTVRGNGHCGLMTLAVPEEQSPHGLVVEECLFEKNCAEAGEAEIMLDAPARNMRIARNRLRPRAGKGGLLAKDTVPPFAHEGNDEKVSG